MASLEFDIFLNITKRPEFILYKNRVGPSAANVAYVSSDALSSDANISIEDTSGTLGPNRVVTDVTVHNNKHTFFSETADFLLTDMFSVGTNSSPSVPLFYQHKLQNFDKANGDEIVSGSSETPAMEIYDDLLFKVSLTERLIDKTDGIFYSNLNSYYNIIPDRKNDPEGIEYAYYYIDYSVKDGSTDVVTRYRELLNNELIYTIAEYEDYNPDTLTLNVDAKVYTLEETIGVEGYTVTIPVGKNIGIDSKQTAKLKLLWPTSRDYTDPWHIRVSNGRFYAKGHQYKILEEQFNAQSFNPQIGIKKVEKETPTIISKSIIKTDYENIKIDDTVLLHTYIRITKTHIDTNGDTQTTLYSFTNNPSPPSPYTLHIKSIDKATGFIEIESIKLDATDSIEVDYYYNEKYYEFTVIDLNPIRNEEMLQQMIAFYIDPIDFDVSLKHGIFNLDGTVKGPLEFKYHAVTNPDGFATLEEFQNSSTNVQGEINFILGYITVGESSGVDDLTIFDTRIFGGGIKNDKEMIKEVEESYPEYNFFFDNGCWDGKPFPGNLNYLIKIPTNGLIEGYDGVVRVKEVKDIIGKHTALGVYPVVRAYGPEIKFDIDSGFEIVRNSGTLADVTINWKAVDNASYRVYYRKVTGTGWLDGGIFTPSAQTNKVVSMTKTIADINSGFNYYFTVIGRESVGGNTVELFTQHISSIDTALKTKTNDDGTIPDSLNILEVEIPVL